MAEPGEVPPPSPFLPHRGPAQPRPQGGGGFFTGLLLALALAGIWFYQTPALTCVALRYGVPAEASVAYVQLPGLPGLTGLAGPRASEPWRWRQRLSVEIPPGRATAYSYGRSFLTLRPGDRLPAHYLPSWPGFAALDEDDGRVCGAFGLIGWLVPPVLAVILALASALSGRRTRVP